MGYTSNGLLNKDQTRHYHIEYGTGLPSGLSLAKGLETSCEADFALMQSWFGGLTS